MFLYDPSLRLSNDTVFHYKVFQEKRLLYSSKDKLYPPCAKTLNKYFLSSGDECHSTQSEKFIQRLKDISVARGVSADF